MYVSRINETNELVNVGYVGVIKALKSFDPDKGSFKTYSARFAKFSIIHFIQNQRIPNSVEL